MDVRQTPNNIYCEVPQANHSGDKTISQTILPPKPECGWGKAYPWKAITTGKAANTMHPTGQNPGEIHLKPNSVLLETKAQGPWRFLRMQALPNYIS